MALSTTDLGGGGNNLPKTISPGNHTLKINSIQLEDFRFIENAKHLLIHVETKPIEGFEGFAIDKDNPEAGNYKGQIGRVKASQYAYADGETKSGIKIQRDKSIMMFLQNFCKTLGLTEWFIAQDRMHETIEDFVNEFNKTATFKDKYFEFCVAGKEYMNKSGYINYDMWLPKAENGKYGLANEPGRVITYNEAKHLRKLEVTEVKSFGDDDEFALPKKKNSSTDFSLD